MKINIYVKDKIILISWILGLLIITSLVWILSRPLQANSLLRTANSVLISSNDSRRLVSFSGRAGNETLLGYWYSMNTTDKMFVFSVFHDGILIPLGAVVSDNGIVKEIIPLSLHAAHVFDYLPDSVLQIYINRIETAYTEGIR